LGRGVVGGWDHPWLGAGVSAGREDTSRSRIKTERLPIPRQTNGKGLRKVRGQAQSGQKKGGVKDIKPRKIKPTGKVKKKKRNEKRGSAILR